jgi:hypothetical protein
LLLIFIVVHLLKLKIRFFKNYYNKPFEDLRNEIDKITEKNNGEVNIKNEDLLEHKYDAKKEKDEIDEEEKRIEAYKDYDDNEDVPLNESNKNSKQFENKEKDSSSLNDKNNNLDQNTIYSKGRRIIKIDEISIKDKSEVIDNEENKGSLGSNKGKGKKKGKKNENPEGTLIDDSNEKEYQEIDIQSDLKSESKSDNDEKDKNKIKDNKTSINLIDDKEDNKSNSKKDDKTSVQIDDTFF